MLLFLHLVEGQVAFFVWIYFWTLHPVLQSCVIILFDQYHIALASPVFIVKSENQVVTTPAFSACVCL